MTARKINKKDKILVTGGTGFLGAYLIKQLLEEGYSNIAITCRKGSRIDLIKNLIDKIEVFEADILDIPALEEVINDRDIVIHAAANVSVASKARESLMKNNVEGTQNVLNLCLSKGVKRFVYLSSVVALGRSKPKAKINEKIKGENNDYNTPYAISKHLAEQEVWRAYYEGLESVIINPALILGAGYWSKGSGRLVQQVYDGIAFYPKGTTGIVDVRDVAEMTIKIMESNICGERFICCGGNISYKELFNELGNNLKVRAPQRTLSNFLAELVWRYFKVKSLLNGKDPVVTQDALKISMNDYYYDNQKSIDVLDFEYRKLKTSIKETSESFLKSLEQGLDFAIFDKDD